MPPPTTTRFRSPGEQDTNQLNDRGFLCWLRCCTNRTGEITRGMLVLQLH